LNHPYPGGVAALVLDFPDGSVAAATVVPVLIGQ
jgi:hypothetical protein